MNIWQVLEIDPTTNKGQIKQAYVKKLKKCKPEVDPEGFKLLRQSYEMALKHAAGLSVNINFENNTSNQQQNPNESGNSPEQAVIQLLNALFDDQRVAVTMLEDYKQKSIFHNLEFSEQFQKILAMHLLKISHGYLFFTNYVISFFNWFERVEHDKSDSFFINSLINLINQTESFRFLQYLKFLKNISNKKEAQQKNVKWDECFAAKILLSHTTIMQFLVIRCFKNKKAQAILSFCKEIDGKYFEVLNLGVNLSSFINSYKILYKNPFKAILKYLWIPVVVMLIFFNSMSPTKDSAFSVPEAAMAQPQIDAKPVVVFNNDLSNDEVSHVDNNTSKYKNKIILNKKIKVPDSATVFTTVASNSLYQDMVPISSGIIALEDGTLINGDMINSLVKANHISIEKIIYKTFNKFIQDKLSVDFKKVNSNVLITVIVNEFGLRNISSPGSEHLVPVLIITVETEYNGRVYSDKYTVVGNEKTITLTSASWSSLQSSPKELEELWSQAAYTAANSWFYTHDDLI